MELLAALRDTGEQLLEAALPSPAEVPAILGALIGHLEQHVENLAEVELAKLAGLKEPPPNAAPAATGAATDAGAVPIESTPAAPPAPATPAAPADGVGNQAAAPAATDAELEQENADLKTRLAQLEAQLSAAQSSAPVVDTGQDAAPA